MSVLSVLKQADIFYEMTPTQLELIASICEEREYNPGDVLFAENTPGDSLYIIADGTVDIQVDPALITGAAGGTSYTIATLRAGQSFGEVALVDEGRRSASALITEFHTHLLVIPRDKLMLLCDQYAALGYRLMRNLAADLAMKIRNTDLQVRDRLIWTHAQKPESGEAN